MPDPAQDPYCAESLPSPPIGLVIKSKSVAHKGKVTEYRVAGEASDGRVPMSFPLVGGGEKTVRVRVAWVYTQWLAQLASVGVNVTLAQLVNAVEKKTLGAWPDGVLKSFPYAGTGMGKSSTASKSMAKVEYVPLMADSPDSPFGSLKFDVAKYAIDPAMLAEGASLGSDAFKAQYEAYISKVDKKFTDAMGAIVGAADLKGVAGGATTQGPTVAEVMAVQPLSGPADPYYAIPVTFVSTPKSEENVFAKYWAEAQKEHGPGPAVVTVPRDFVTAATAGLVEIAAGDLVRLVDGQLCSVVDASEAATLVVEKVADSTSADYVGVGGAKGWKVTFGDDVLMFSDPKFIKAYAPEVETEYIGSKYAYEDEFVAAEYAYPTPGTNFTIPTTRNDGSVVMTEAVVTGGGPDTGVKMVSYRFVSHGLNGRMTLGEFLVLTGQVKLGDGFFVTLAAQLADDHRMRTFFERCGPKLTIDT